MSVLSPLSVKASREDKVRYALLAVGAQGHGADARVTHADYAKFIRVTMGERIPSHVCDAIADQVIVSRDKRPRRSEAEDGRVGGGGSESEVEEDGEDEEEAPSISVAEFAMRLNGLDFDSALTINF